MADLRLIVGALVALGALAGCTAADAQPPAGTKPPPGWTPQPAIAAAAKAALGKQPIEAIEAHGDPAMGCYMLWMSLRTTGAASEVATQLVDRLAKPEPGAKRTLAISEVVKPTTAEGVLSFAFASPPYEGHLRARIGNGKLAALACFANQREPLACQTACTALFAGDSR